MKKLIAIVCAGLFSGVFADTILYVKPGGTGEGTSWSDAAGLEAAVAAARDGASVTTIYAAKGVYTLTATLRLNSNVALYGGFAGESTGETPEARDLKANPTILSGDVNGDGVWQRCYPMTGTAEVTEEPIVKDGKINDLVLENDYDTYAPAAKNHSDNLWRVVTIMEKAAATCVLDGVTVTGGGRGISTGDGTVEDGFRRDRGSTLFVASGATPIIRNCRFVGNTAYVGCVFFNSSTPTFEDNEVSFNQSGYYGAFYSGSSAATVENTAFVGNYRRTDFNASGAAAVELNRSLTLKNCTFTRNYLRKFRTNNPQEAVCICSEYGDYTGFLVRDCTFRCNSCYDTYAGVPAPMVYCYAGQRMLSGCHFASNVTTVATTTATPVIVAGCLFFNAAVNLTQSCTFEANEISVTAPNATSVVAAPCYSVSSDQQVANATFWDNIVSVDAPLATEKDVARAFAWVGANGSHFVFNSTFAGMSALPDVVSRQTEDGASGVKILNSVLWATGAATAVPRVVCGGTAGATIGCSVVNCPDLLAENAVLSESQDSDPLLQPLESVVVGKVPVMRLGAKLPDVRNTYDVATFGYYGATIYAYRRTPTSAWIDTWQAGSTKTLIPDALGEARPAGGFTIGAAQALTDKAENGLTVVYRMDPAGVARLDGKKTQVVDVGETTEAVMGVSTDESYSFRRWRDETGETFSEDNPVTVTAEAAGTLVLTAQFNPAAVDYTFDLGPYATFDDDGSTNKVLTLVPDSIVEIPAYTICDGFSFKAWAPEVPAVVGTLDATFTLQVYRRDTYLQPGDDIAAAIAEAKLYAGDGDVVVHLAAGEYTISEAIVLPSKVKLLGEAGATMKRTNISGNNCWTIANPSTGADIDTGTINIEGIAFLGGGVATGLSRGRIVDCVFTNCHNGINGAVSFHIDATKAVTNSVSLVNCGFYRCTSALRGWGNGGCGETAYVTNCVFYGNDNTFDSHNGTPLGAAVALSGNAGKFYGCRFEKNSSSNPASDYGIIAGGALSFDRCQIVDNVCTGDYNIIRKATYSDINFTHTLFLNNRVVGDRYSTGYARFANQPTGIVVEGAMGSPSYVNCAFVSNVVDRTEAASYEGVTTVPCHIVYGNRVSTMRYCFFEGNVVRATSSVAGTKPVCSVYSAYAEIESSIEGCTFHDNMASDGAIYMREERNLSGVIQPLWIWNSIFSGSDAEAAPVRYASEDLTVGVHLRHCVASAQDDARIIRDDTCKTGPVAFAAKTEEIDGLIIRPVADAAAARTKPVKWYFTTNGKKMYYNEGLKAYRRLNGDCWDSYMTQYTPYTTVADMFGEVPEGGKALAGAYQNHVKKGLMLLLR